MLVLGAPATIYQPIIKHKCCWFQTSGATMTRHYWSLGFIYHTLHFATFSVVALIDRMIEQKALA